MAVDTATTSPPPASPAAGRPRRRRRAIDAFLVVVGELLITAGVITGLFVVWQLFYTDVQSDRWQASVIEELAWHEPLPAADPIEIGPLLIPDELKHYTTDGAPVVPTPAFTETFATLYVPRWGNDYIKPISEGVTRKDVLDPLGVGHYPDTAMPGQIGNFAIAGHRTTYGKPFHNIDLLQPGDALVIETADAWFVYRMVSNEIVRPTEVRVIAANPNQPEAAPDGAWITLTSCHPKYSAAQRFIVHGQFEYWAEKGNGFPPEIFEEVA